MLYMFFSSSDVTDFQKFEANLEVKGFLKEPQQFQWSSFPNSILVEQDTVKPEINLQPPVPAIPLKEILGPWWVSQPSCAHHCNTTTRPIYVLPCCCQPTQIWSYTILSFISSPALLPFHHHHRSPVKKIAPVMRDCDRKAVASS